MSTFLQRTFVCTAFFLLMTTVHAQQLSNANFEDWSGAAFNGNPQPKDWNASNVEQFGFKFNFAHKEAGRNGGFCMMVQDQAVGAAGITEVSPGYFALGQPWAYVPGLTSVGQATAGTVGGILWQYRPDSLSVWIKRTGNNVDKEDFYIVYYAWEKDAQGNSYGGKNGSCTSYNRTNEESDIRIALNPNSCGTQVAGDQVSEGMWREKAEYSDWTNIKVPIYYLNGNTTKWMNIIFSASNYPNARANSGFYEGNSLYVDDVQLIYSSKIQTLLVDGMTWNGFDPNTEDIQYYALGENATVVPTIQAKRGAGSLTNAKGVTKAFPGRTLVEGAGKDYTVTYGNLTDQPTVITVRAEDGSSTTTYKIQFQKAASSNAKLAGISYTIGGVEKTLADFTPNTANYVLTLPYGTTSVPTISYTFQENGQTATVSQASSLSGTTTIHVTAPNGTSTRDYTVTFSIAQLADNNLAGIKVNGNDLPGFNPTQSNYKVSLPVGTSTLAVTPVKKYDGQTVTVSPSPLPSGAAIDGSVVEIAVTTPGNQTPRKYRLTIKLEASSYSYLSDLQIVGDQILKVNPSLPSDSTKIDFTPENMIYYVTLKMGTTSLPAITAVKGDEYQSEPVVDTSAGVDGTARVTATAANGDQSVYKIIFSTLKSDISTLADIKIGGESLADFSPEKTTYSVALPVGTTQLPTIEAVPGDEYQNVLVTEAGLSGKTRITVTAGDGSTTIYQISFSVEAFTDNTLQSLSVEGYSLQNSAGENVTFDPEVLEYWVNLPQGVTTRPEVSYILQNPAMQTASPRGSTDLPSDYRVTVRPQNGASRTYIIHFTVSTSSNTDLSMIYLDGTPISGFRSDSLHYIDSLPEGITRIPAVTFDKAEKEQRVISVLDGKRQIITVTAQDGKTKKDYTIDFIVRASANAFLEMIYLDSVVISGFKKQTLEYFVELKEPKCPQITVDKAPGQQVTITAPYGLGDAVIKVLPETGSANTYTIHFVAPAAESVQLLGITVNEVGIAGYRADSMYYEATYEKQYPEIKYIKRYEAQDVALLWKGNTAYIHVTDTIGMTATYSIAFTRLYSNDASLKSIKANGVLIESPFDPAKHEYSKNLPAGSEYPEISYEANDASQIIFFGQVASGEWHIKVQAENGDEALYKVVYSIDKYADATLQSMELEGKTLTPAFDPNTFDYAVTIDEGVRLPVLKVETRKGQTVLQSDLDDKHQQVIVYAESGASHTYNITYTRVPSSNASLADILIDGVSLEDFDPNVLDYVDSLAWRTKVVPNVFPVAQQDNQTITTFFSRPNSVTKIHVEAQDKTTKDYTIFFPVRKSSNNKLGSLMLSSTDVDLVPAFNPDSLNYTVLMPIGATECPSVIFEKAQENSKEISEQRIDLISRPVGDTTKIIVTAENGDQRIYSIHFKESYPKEPNRLTMIRVKIDNNEDLEKELYLKKDQRDTTINIPFGSRSFVVEYEKMFPEQTVFVQPGGVHHPTILTVKSNRPDEADEVYTITPDMPTADPAVLTEIKINGTPIENFDPEQFSYIVNVTSKPVLRYTVNKGAEINILEQTPKHWQAEVTSGTRKNTYDVWYYYVNDTIPNPNFSEWVDMEVYKGDPKDGWADIYYDNRDPIKPKGWNTAGDALDKDVWMGTMYFYPTELIERINEKQVRLTSVYGNGLGGTVPAFITLGKVTGAYGRFGATTFDIASGISFHNSPDQMILTYNSSEIYDHNLIQYTLYGMDGDTTLTWSDTETSSALKTVTFDLSKANKVAGDPTTMNIVLCAAHQIGGFNMNHHTTMVVDRIAMTFNHTLKALVVDGDTAQIVGNAFTARLKDPERIEKPILDFVGEVEDQSQLVTWGAKTVDGDTMVWNATIRNFAENGEDYTDYTLAVRRPLDLRNQLADLKLDGKTITGFAADKFHYDVEMTYKQLLADVQPVAASSLQTITTAFNAADSTITITVTPEKGEPTVYTIKFTFPLSNDVTLNALSADGLTPAFDPAVTAYDITAENWPLITYVKKSDLQTVELINGVLTVTAEDGSTGTYTITRHDPVAVTDAKIKEFYLGENMITDLGAETFSKEADKPEEYISFVRQFEADSVVFIQCDTAMHWKAFGWDGTSNINHTYSWLYPSTPSANNALSKVTIDGVDYEDFIASNLEYEIASDTTFVLAPVAANSKQTLATTYQTEEGGALLFSTEVTAENGDKRTYKFKVVKPKDATGTLAGILKDGVLLEDFDPAVLNYDIVLPVPAVKIEQPLMPSITYLVGHKAQTVDFTAGALNGDPTEIIVTSEDGSAQTTYLVSVSAQKSACVDLTGITVNGVAVDQFEPGRHFYSTSLNTSTIDVDYTADDRFLTVTPSMDVIIPERQYNYILSVKAENGDEAQYEVMIYVENQSNDAQLANILLDGKDFVDFERSLNEDLHFRPTTAEYEINLPSGTTVLPEVSAKLKMDGQKVSITQLADSILLDVEAVDGTPNQYVLHFVVPQSKNANLSMIFLDGDSLPNFDPDIYFYQYDLKVGVHDLPEVTGQKAEGAQLIAPVEMDIEKRQATIKVQAEDRTYATTYVVAFQFTQSDVDTLAMIYANGDSLEGFDPYVKYYEKTLPVGTAAFPELYWQDGDDFQTVRMDTVSGDSVSLVRQIIVTSESMHTRTYTVAYTIEKSTVDTLNMIFIDQKQLPNFKATTYEYSYTLSSSYAQELDGELPVVEFIAGDDYQTVLVSQMPEDSTYAGSNSLKQKSVITVTAANGMTKTYTIHYPVELSTDAKLNMIMLEGKPLSNFDAERYNYKVEIDSYSAVPVVSVIKKEEAQTYEIRVMDDTVRIEVTAESHIDIATYTLVFDRILSGNTRLNNIILTDTVEAFVSPNQFRFNPAWDSYTVDLNYEPGMDKHALLPKMEFDLADSLQTIRLESLELEDGSIQFEIIVVAPNKDEGSYFITFKFAKPGDNNLKAIFLNDQPIEDFIPTETEYTYIHPFGTDSADYFTPEDLTFILADSLATAVDSITENLTLIITVTAQNGKQKTYYITQSTGPDDNADLAWIAVDGDTIQGFDPDQTFYTYDVYKGAATPSISAKQASENASDPTVGDISAVGDTCRIIVQAASGKRKIYEVYIRETFNKGKDATANDVVIKRVPGAAQFFVSSIRSGVSFALYDINRQVLLAPKAVPEANPNYTKTYPDLLGNEVLTDVISNGEGLLVDVELGKPYIYVFWYKNKKVISGIIMAQ